MKYRDSNIGIEIDGEVLNASCLSPLEVLRVVKALIKPIEFQEKANKNYSLRKCVKNILLSKLDL